MPASEMDVIKGLEASRRTAWAKYHALRDQLPRETEAGMGGYALAVTLQRNGHPVAEVTFGVDGRGRPWTAIADPWDDDKAVGWTPNIYAQVSVEEPGVVDVGVMGEELRAHMFTSAHERGPIIEVTDVDAILRRRPVQPIS